MIDWNRWLATDSLVVFLFHGVIAKQVHQTRNYTRKHLPLDYFTTVVGNLRNEGYPLSMDDIVDHVRNQEAFPPRSFAITFDDGFANNYEMAAPVLADLGIPATFYITTSFVNDNAMSWIDRIEFCLEAAASGALQLPWEDTPRSFQSVQDKVSLLDAIRHRVKSDASEDVDALVRSISNQLGQEPVTASDDPLDKKMTWPQVAELARAPLFQVGGHSHTHPILSFCDQEKLRQEIDTSLDLLQHKAGIGPAHYSYPEGLAHCYSDEVIALLQQRGVVCCPTAIEGVNTHADGLFHLKRVMVV